MDQRSIAVGYFVESSVRQRAKEVEVSNDWKGHRTWWKTNLGSSSGVYGSDQNG